MDEVTLKEVVEWLGKGGAALVVGATFSLLLSWWPAFQEWNWKKKVLVLVLGTLGISNLAVAISLYMPVSWLEYLEPYWKASVLGVTALLGSQVWHGAVNLRLLKKPGIPLDEAPSRASAPYP